MEDDIRQSLIETFREEARELLADLESVLLELEVTPDDAGLVARAFRALHTIKGNAAMFGFANVESFAHDLEQVFDQLRNKEARISKKLIDLALCAQDEITSMLSGREEDIADIQQRVELLEAIQELVEHQEVEVAPSSGEVAATPGSEDAGEKIEVKEAVYRVRFRPPEEIFGTGPEIADLMRQLRELGPCRMMALTEDVPPLEALNPTNCYLRWDIVIGTARGEESLYRILQPIREQGELRVDVIEEDVEIGGEAGERLLGEIMVQRGDLKEEDLRQVLSDRKLIGEDLVERQMAAPQTVESALLEQKALRDLQTRRVDEDKASTIRVHSEKLDGLVDLVGELVTVQARLSRLETEIQDSELSSIAEEVERLTWELRDNTFSIRMVPIGTTFSKFRRLVRDLSREVGREVELVTEGAETELDKTVIERLNDPLVHLIRNSIDHGIEPPGEREKVGKRRAGTVRLSASQAGADILIEIGDDGGGLDAEAIRRKAVEKGLVDRAAHLETEEILPLIFLPGFSTTGKISSLSGRGVGMDVVKTSIDTLQGSVAIRSERGRGTTISIRLPLTLAIIEGLEVVIGREHFVIPLSYVEECVELHRRKDGVREARHLTNVRGELVPYVRLREWFRTEGDPPPIQQTVITRTDGQRVGLVVDHVVGEHQTVVKSLGKVYRGTEGFSGATILGDGAVALILDVPHLVKGAEMEEKSRSMDQENRAERRKQVDRVNQVRGKE